MPAKYGDRILHPKPDAIHRPSSTSSSSDSAVR